MLAARLPSSFSFSSIGRKFVTKQSEQKIIKYTDTINLPKTNFPARLSKENRLKTEQRIQITAHKLLYDWQRNNLDSVEEFVLHDGPPYANGELHLGHAVNKILKDIILRNKIIAGTKIHHRPGWDCHGLPIELKAIKSSDTNPLSVRKRAREFALATIKKQKESFEAWGVTGDWSNSYITLNSHYSKNQIEIFLDLYKKKLIFRDLKPVYWSPSSRSALAEAELEYDACFKSPSLTLRLELTKCPASIQSVISKNDRIYALIWTTTPWTLPANQGVCFNENLDYNFVRWHQRPNELYLVAADTVDRLSAELNVPIERVLSVSGSECSNFLYRHPIDGTEMPFMHGDHVQVTKGSGLVHTAPAHGPDDYLVSVKNQMEISCLVDETGKYNEKAPEFLRTKSVLDEGNQAVLNYLNEQDIVKLETITHSYPIDWRTKKPVIFRASYQWFINTHKLKEKALSAIKPVSIYPKNVAEQHKKNLTHLIDKRPYWCISRQRAWGVPIPVIYSKKTGEPMTNETLIDHIGKLLIKDGNMDFWWSLENHELFPKHVLDSFNTSLEDIEKKNEILDIWFDSGISWSNALDGQKIADLYLEGVDQLTGWFQSSLLTSVALRNQSPYKSLFIHGFTVDEHGAKMSKSLGNIISPKSIIDKYGTDVLRWWVASHAPQHSSIVISQNLLENSADCYQKQRLLLKYLIGILNKDDCINQNWVDWTPQSYLDQYVLHQVSMFDETIAETIKDHQFNRIASSVVNFSANTISGLYLHLIKDRLYCGTHEEIQNVKKVIKCIYMALCKAMWPIMPFLVEESWSYLHNTPFYASSCTKAPSWINNHAEKTIGTCLDLKQDLHQQTKQNNTWMIKLSIQAGKNQIAELKQMHPVLNIFEENSQLTEFLQVSSIKLSETNDLSTSPWRLSFEKNDGVLCPRCRRLSLSVSTSDSAVCKRCSLVLNGL